MNVRCNYGHLCGATDREDASNWCEHYGPHKPGSTEEPCDSICYGYDGVEEHPVKVNCEREEEK